MADKDFRHHPLTRIMHYFFLIIFLPALRPLVVNYSPPHLILYLTGLGLVLFIIMYGNSHPLVRLGSDGLRLYPHKRRSFRHIPYPDIARVANMGSGFLLVESTTHLPLTIRLTAADITIFCELMEEQDIHVQS